MLLGVCGDNFFPPSPSFNIALQLKNADFEQFKKLVGDEEYEFWYELGIGHIPSYPND